MRTYPDLVVDAAVVVLQVLEHVRGAPAFGSHLLLAQFTDGEVVTHNRAVRVLQVTEILPDCRGDVLRRWVELRGFDTPRCSECGDRFLMYT